LDFACCKRLSHNPLVLNVDAFKQALHDIAPSAHAGFKLFQGFFAVFSDNLGFLFQFQIEF
jgi:hypothetical protein